MWVFTTDGFFSAVQKPEQAGTGMLTIRSRKKKDLVALLKKIELPLSYIISDKGTDYEFRIKIPALVWGDYLAQTGEAIDYSNFKHEVQLKDAERAKIYMSVWSELLCIAHQSFNKIYKKDMDWFTELDMPLSNNSGYFDDGGIWRESKKRKRR